MHLLSFAFNGMPPEQLLFSNGQLLIGIGAFQRPLELAETTLGELAKQGFDQQDLMFDGLREPDNKIVYLYEWDDENGCGWFVFYK
jgi:hypothetical protein